MQSHTIFGAMSSTKEGTGLKVVKISQAALEALKKITAPVNWLQNYEAALEQAAIKTGSEADGAHLVMILFTGSDWCNYCIKLNEEVLQTNSFRIWFNKHQIVPLLVDFPHNTTQPSDLQAQNAGLKLQYNINGFPTVVIIKVTGGFCTPNGKCSYTVTEVGKVYGYPPGTGADTWISIFCSAANIPEEIPN